MAVNREVSYFDNIKFNIIFNNKERIYSYSIERSGSSFLKLSFVNIKLPQYSYVEFQYGKNAIQRAFFNNTDKTVIIIPDERVNIRVILTKPLSVDDIFSLELRSIEYNGDSREIIGLKDQRKPYMYYDGTEIGEHTLATGSARMGGWGTCSLIGNENHVLTNQSVVVSDTDLAYGEIWFNWFNQSSDPESPVNEPVRLKPGRILTMDLDSYRDQGCALLTLDEFDYVNSNVKELFGGLEISKKNPHRGESIYLPQYGNGSPGPMYISDMITLSNERYAAIETIQPGGDKITHSADTGPRGALGSPVISRDSHQIVGLHSIGIEAVNMGISAQKLNAELDSFISDSNESVTGLGNVTSFNLELTPFDIMGRLIPIDLDKKGTILPFDTVTIDDGDSYSLIEVEAIDLITDEVFSLTFKASLVGDEYQTNIHDNNITGNTFLKIYDFDTDSYSLLKFWLVFKVNDSIDNIRNYVVRTVLDYYDPYEIPFDIESAEVLDLNIWKYDELRESSVSYTIEGYDSYGFVTFNHGQGPVNLVHADEGYSEVKALLRHSSGDEILVNLRGERDTDCYTRPMNSSIGCESFEKYSRLTLSFYPEDNDNLVFSDEGIYEGIVPLQARKWNSTDTEDILINISLLDPSLNYEPD